MDARRRRAHPDDEAQAQAHRREVLRRDRGAVQGLNASPRTNESLEVAAEAIERFNEGDLEAFWGFHDQDCFMATDPDWPDGGAHQGIEAYRRFLDQFLEAFETVWFEARRDPEPLGEVALFRGRWVGKGAASGIDTESPWFTIVVAAGQGKLQDLRFFFRDEDALEYARSVK